MKCDQCGKHISDSIEYEDYFIECRECFDKTRVLINEDPDKKVEWVGQKKFNDTLTK